MALENRQFERFPASLKAVLLKDDLVGNPHETGSLCVIDNLSSGGAFLVLVGASRPVHSHRVTLAVDQKILPCEIVLEREAGLHCKFAGNGPEPPEPVAELIAGHVKAPIRSRPLRDDRGSKTAAALRAASFRMTGIYQEGFAAGAVQIDPNPDTLDEIVDAINPYPPSEERSRWTLGFKDAVFQLLKH